MRKVNGRKYFCKNTVDDIDIRYDPINNFSAKTLLHIHLAAMSLSRNYSKTHTYIEKLSFQTFVYRHFGVFMYVCLNKTKYKYKIFNTAHLFSHGVHQTTCTCYAHI